MSKKLLRLPFLLVAAAGSGCDDETPEPQICFPGAMECTDSGLRICSQKGVAWLEGRCGTDQTCIAGACDDPIECPDLCKDIVCEPGNRVCADDNVFVYECDDTGTELQRCGSCAAEPIGGICVDGDCISLCGVAQKSYIGCEYFAADLDNAFVGPLGKDQFGQARFLDAAGSQYAIVLSNPDPLLSAFVSITRGPVTGSPPSAQCDGEVQPDPNLVDARIVPPLGIEVFELPRRDVNATVIDRLAYRVASNLPITVYQFNPLENVEVFSNDASVLLPTDAVGTKYYVMTRGQTFEDLKGFLTVIGIAPTPTEVKVTVTSVTLGGRDLTNDRAVISTLQPGETLTVELERFEVLNIETDAIGGDLTGSYIEADQPVVVFAGSEAANAPSTSLCDLDTMTCEFDGLTSCQCPLGSTKCTPDSMCSKFITCCADHLEQQLTPISTWGKEYVAVRSVPRFDPKVSGSHPLPAKDVWRVLASMDNTQVTLDPPQVGVLPVLAKAGDWFEFESGEDFVIRADKPVLVGQFLAAEHAPNPGYQLGDASTGDPAFIIAVPVRQYRDAYVFLAPDKYKFDYVSIAAPVGASVRLDGKEVATLPNVEVMVIGDTGWQAIRLPISDNNHNLLCPQRCSVMVHGYDQYVSYGYPGGLNLEE